MQCPFYSEDSKLQNPGKRKHTQDDRTKAILEEMPGDHEHNTEQTGAQKGKIFPPGLDQSGRNDLLLLDG